MARVEVVSTQEYSDTIYQVDKIDKGATECIVLRDTMKAPYGVRSIFEYKKVEVSVKSSMISWHNLFFCSNNYGPESNLEYMNNAVQEGRKPAATAYVSDEQYQMLLKALPSNCGAIPYGGTDGHISTAFIFRKGSLSGWFDYELVRQVYMLHGIGNIDWYRVKKSFQKPMDYFSDKRKCGFDIQSGAHDLEDKIVTGLLLGYPVESTICFLKRDYKTFPKYVDRSVCIHFETSSNPYTDMLGNKWVKENQTIYCTGWNEMLYY